MHSLNLLIKSLLDDLILPFAIFDAGGGLVYSNSSFDRLFKRPSLAFDCFRHSKFISGTILKKVLTIPGPRGGNQPLLVKCIPVFQPDFSGYIIYTEDTVLISGHQDREISSASLVTGMLSKREARILFFIYNGLSAREISDSLSISVNTVKTHIKKIYRKFGVQSRLQLIRQLFDERIYD